MKRERIEDIAEILDKRGKMTLEQLEEVFPNVSQMTLRRDLFQLEEDGRIIRIRGGAMSVKEVQKVSGEAYTKKTTINTDAKIVIAQKAAALIDEGSCVFLDGGTTAMYLAKEMPNLNCHVFTNGIAVAMELAQKKNINITVVGGQLMKDNLSTSSPAARAYFDATNFEIAIVSATAFTPAEGFSCNSQIESELLKDVSLRIEETGSADSYRVCGRGEMHLSILIENMRREGYEFAVSKAEVLYKEDENGHKLEPMERAFIDIPDEFSGNVIDRLSQRKGELQAMKPLNAGTTRLEFLIPSRGLIGYRGEFMTDTKGNGVINTEWEGYGPFKGEIPYRKKGSLIAYEDGETITYGLYNAQERGTLFIGPGERVYGGMIVGEHAKSDDIEVNVCKKKNLTNTRSSGADEALRLSPPRELSLEQALDYIDTDELLEVTPKSLRIRKKILDGTERYRSKRNAANAAKSQN